MRGVEMVQAQNKQAKRFA